MLLGAKPVSQVYLEGHLGAFINSKLVSDEDTLAALANAEERETRKSSTIMQCKEIFQEMKTEQNCRMTTPDNFANYPVTVRIEKPNIMKKAKRKGGGGEGHIVEGDHL